MSKRYEAIDGLRTIGTIGILMMHVRGNAHYEIDSYWYTTIVASFTNFVFLFMIISAFSMCCGYFEKINEGKIRLEDFYIKRFARIWPYFAMLVVLDLIVSPCIENLYESFANLTLAFGLLPNANISVIGVGWFLGVIFLFYMLFPFFVFLIGNKRRAWFSFSMALIFHYICEIYFFNTDHVVSAFNGRVNIVYCAAYFLAGGLIYLYRDELGGWADKYRWPILCMLIVLAIAYLRMDTSIITMLPLFSLMLIYSLGTKRKALHNKITYFIGSISLEIYLCHMVIYRVLEKMNLLYIVKPHEIAYFSTVALVLTVAVLFACFTKKTIKNTAVYSNIVLKRVHGGKGNG